jgi:hypothetical protein
MPHLSQFSLGQGFDLLGGFNPNIHTIGDLNIVLAGSPELRRAHFNGGVRP